MKIVTDLKYIARMAKLKEDENWAFRTFLKALDMEDERLDAMVQAINDKVSAKIDCTQCANCCREIRPVLDDKDITRFAIGLEMPVQEFRNTHLREDDDKRGEYLFTELPCQFLDGNRCSNYASRPKDCQSFPHLHKPDFRQGLFGVVMNYETCPIVYNVYERLKVKLWRKKRRSTRR